MNLNGYGTVLVDSNSTRTESCVAIRPDREAQTRVGAPKASDNNEHLQIIRPSREMGAGVKILVSAVQSRPSPPFISFADKHLHPAAHDGDSACRVSSQGLSLDRSSRHPTRPPMPRMTAISTARSATRISAT